MREAFIAHANGEVIIPPVGEMTFDDPPGDVHIKYGAFHHGEHYIVKIASGFYNNDQLGVPSSQGMMILFCQQTGQPSCILLDEGKLTDARTAAVPLLRRHLQVKTLRKSVLLAQVFKRESKPDIC